MKFVNDMFSFPLIDSSETISYLGINPGDNNFDRHTTHCEKSSFLKGFNRVVCHIVILWKRSQLNVSKIFFNSHSGIKKSLFIWCRNIHRTLGKDDREYFSKVPNLYPLPNSPGNRAITIYNTVFPFMCLQFLDKLFAFINFPFPSGQPNGSIHKQIIFIFYTPTSTHVCASYTSPMFVL